MGYLENVNVRDTIQGNLIYADGNANWGIPGLITGEKPLQNLIFEKETP